MEDKKMTFTSSNGFTYEISRDALDDMEIFDDLITMEDQNASEAQRIFATTRVFRKMLGDEQKKALDTFLREKDGKVRISAYQREIRELFTGLNESKKK